DRRVLGLDDGTAARYEALVIATGVRPRTLPDADIPGLHVLRTRTDASRLQRRLTPGCRLVVVGGGFLGLEVAATARKGRAGRDRGRAAAAAVERQARP